MLCPLQDHPANTQDSHADSAHIFHGREVRGVPHAAGGMSFMLHLSDHGGDDPEGWTQQEVAGYDGWGHDGGRVWRTGQHLEAEGFRSFRHFGVVPGQCRHTHTHDAVRACGRDLLNFAEICGI